MTYDQIISQLHNKIYAPVYILAGEEPFFIDEICDRIEEGILDETEKAFNQVVLYGRDTNVSHIVSEASQCPMMSNYRLVIIKEAQDLREIDALTPYIQKAIKSTILVICLKNKKLDKRKSLFKSLNNSGCVYFESDKLWDNQVIAWIPHFCASLNLSIDPKSATLLLESLGSDLSKIANELRKLSINIPPKGSISPDLIERYIGISKDYNAFELNRALSQKDILKANNIINYFSQNPKESPIQMIIPIIYSLFVKVLLYQVYAPLNDPKKLIAAIGQQPNKDITQAASLYSKSKVIEVIQLCRRYDARSKGVDSVQSNDGELLRELVFYILH